MKKIIVIFIMMFSISLYSVDRTGIYSKEGVELEIVDYGDDMHFNINILPLNCKIFGSGEVDKKSATMRFKDITSYCSILFKFSKHTAILRATNCICDNYSVSNVITGYYIH
jgi:hypothetical protein